MEHPIKIDDLGVPLFLETSILIVFLVRMCFFFVATYSTSMLLMHPLISIGYCKDPLCFVFGNGPTPVGDRDVVVLMSPNLTRFAMTNCWIKASSSADFTPEFVWLKVTYNSDRPNAPLSQTHSIFHLPLQWEQVGWFCGKRANAASRWNSCGRNGWVEMARPRERAS